MHVQASSIYISKVPLLSKACAESRCVCPPWSTHWLSSAARPLHLLKPLSTSHTVSTRLSLALATSATPMPTAQLYRLACSSKCVACNCLSRRGTYVWVKQRVQLGSLLKGAACRDTMHTTTPPQAEDQQSWSSLTTMGLDHMSTGGLIYWPNLDMQVSKLYES